MTCVKLLTALSTWWGGFVDKHLVETERSTMTVSAASVEADLYLQATNKRLRMRYLELALRILKGGGSIDNAVTLQSWGRALKDFDLWTPDLDKYEALYWPFPIEPGEVRTRLTITFEDAQILIERYRLLGERVSDGYASGFDLIVLKTWGDALRTYKIGRHVLALYSGYERY